MTRPHFPGRQTRLPRGVTVLAVTLMLAPALAGCLAIGSGPANDEAGRAASGGGSDGDRLGTTPVHEDDEPTGPELEAAVRVAKVANGSAWIDYRIVGTENGTLTYTHDEGPASEPVTVAAGNRTHRIGPLHWNASYTVTLRAENTSDTVEASATVRTPPNPYTWATGEAIVVQPGVEVEGCTLGFLFTNPTNTTVYGMMPAHCFEEDGTRPEAGMPVSFEFDQPGLVESFLTNASSEEAVLGELVWVAEQGKADAVLIAIDDRWRPFVSPRVRHWTGPVGYTNATGALNDEVCFYGQHGADPAVRPRCGRFEGYSDPYMSSFGFRAETEQGGDSGAPVLHYETGRAIGIILGHTLRLVVGHTVCGFMNVLAEDGFDLRLATAGYDPPESVPTAPSPPPEGVFLGEDAPTAC